MVGRYFGRGCLLLLLLLFSLSAERHTKQKRKKKKNSANLKNRLVRGSSLSIALGKMASFGEQKETAVSQDWRHKKEKPSYQSFSLMVSYQKM